MSCIRRLMTVRHRARVLEAHGLGRRGDATTLKNYEEAHPRNATGGGRLYDLGVFGSALTEEEIAARFTSTGGSLADTPRLVIQRDTRRWPLRAVGGHRLEQLRGHRASTGGSGATRGAGAAARRAAAHGRFEAAARHAAAA